MAEVRFGGAMFEVSMRIAPTNNDEYRCSSTEHCKRASKTDSPIRWSFGYWVQILAPFTFNDQQSAPLV